MGGIWLCCSLKHGEVSIGDVSVSVTLAVVVQDEVTVKVNFVLFRHYTRFVKQRKVSFFEFGSTTCARLLSGI